MFVCLRLYSAAISRLIAAEALLCRIALFSRIFTACSSRVSLLVARRTTQISSRLITSPSSYFAQPVSFERRRAQQRALTFPTLSTMATVGKCCSLRGSVAYTGGALRAKNLAVVALVCATWRNWKDMVEQGFSCHQHEAQDANLLVSFGKNVALIVWL